MTAVSATPDSPSLHIASLGAAMACAFAFGMGLSLSIPLLSFALDARGVSKTMIGLHTAVGGVATILCAPLIARLTQRFSVITMLTGSVGLGAASLIGFLLFEPLWIWFVLRFTFAVALTVLFVLSEYWINAKAPQDRRGLVLGIYASALSIGFAAGPQILTLVGTDGSTPFLVGAALFVLAALPVILARNLAPEITESPSHSFRSFLFAAPAATLAALAFGAAETGAFALVPLYGTALGFSAATAAGFVSAVALGNLVFQIPLGLLADRIDKRLVLIGCGLVGALGMAIVTLVPLSPPILTMVLFVWGGIVAGLYTVGLALLGTRFTGADLAQANAAFVVMYAVGMMFGPPAAGIGMDLWPPHGLPATLAVLFGLYVLVVFAQLRQEARTKS